MPESRGNIAQMCEMVTAMLQMSNYYPELRTIGGYTCSEKGDEEESCKGVSVMIEDKPYLNMSSNSYLDLHNHPQVVASAIAAARIYGVGTGGSRLTAGTQSPHVELERCLANLKGAEDAVVFSTGFLTNTGIIPALCGNTLHGVVEMLGGQSGNNTTEIFSDRLNHASIIDGLAIATSAAFNKAGNVTLSKYQHRDMTDLERLLRASAANKKLIITDGVFSLHGRFAPLREIVALARKYGAEVYVDDAHGFGVFGEHGHGTAEELGVEGEIDFPVGTLSKAVGCAGGYMTGSKMLCDYLRCAARTYMFNTSNPAMVMAGTIAAVHEIELGAERRKRLREMSGWFRGELLKMKFDIFGSETQIVPVRFGDEQKAKLAVHRLDQAGIFCPCYYYPAVGVDEAMVRANVTAGHTYAQLEHVLDTLRSVGRETGVIR